MAADKSKSESLSVEQRLKSLYQLQTLLSEIDRIKTIRGELPLEVKDLEDSIEGLNTRISNFQAEIKELEHKTNVEKEKIHEWLKRHSARDSEFDAISTLNLDDILAIATKASNKKITIDEIKKVTIYPATEFVLEENLQNIAKKIIEKKYEKARKTLIFRAF